MPEGLDPREVADAYNVPVWLVSREHPRTFTEAWRWRLRWFRRKWRRWT